MIKFTFLLHNLHQHHPQLPSSLSSVVKKAFSVTRGPGADSWWSSRAPEQQCSWCQPWCTRAHSWSQRQPYRRSPLSSSLHSGTLTALLEWYTGYILLWFALLTICTQYTVSKYFPGTLSTKHYLVSRGHRVSVGYITQLTEPFEAADIQHTCE